MDPSHRHPWLRLLPQIRLSPKRRLHRAIHYGIGRDQHFHCHNHQGHHRDHRPMDLHHFFQCDRRWLRQLPTSLRHRLNLRHWPNQSHRRLQPYRSSWPRGRLRHSPSPRHPHRQRRLCHNLRGSPNVRVDRLCAAISFSSFFSVS